MSGRCVGGSRMTWERTITASRGQGRHHLQLSTDNPKQLEPDQTEGSRAHPSRTKISITPTATSLAPHPVVVLPLVAGATMLGVVLALVADAAGAVEPDHQMLVVILTSSFASTVWTVDDVDNCCEIFRRREHVMSWDWTRAASTVSS